jgi:hypothetical protein
LRSGNLLPYVTYNGLEAVKENERDAIDQVINGIKENR